LDTFSFIKIGGHILNFPIQNISNIGREIILFNRQQDGTLSQFRDKNFLPYFFQESPTGIFRTINGKKVNKVFCKLPSEVARKRDENSYEADILYPKRYLIDKVGEIIKSPIKYIFIDIEIQTKGGVPNYLYPNQPITCISIYNSLTKEIKTFYLKDYVDPRISVKDWNELEDKLLKDFVKYIKDEQPDILLGWNFILFDYPYLCARIKKLWNLELAELISPINKMRYGRKEDGIPYPAGISILDYLDLFKKIYNKEVSYSLDSIAQKYLGKPPKKKVDFSQITNEIKEKNIEDIKDMIEIENQKKIISYYDEIRRMGKCIWEDLVWYSKVLDVMLLTEAKKMGIILPSKKYAEDIIIEEGKEFEGAYRRAELGRFLEPVYKLDLSSAYPQAIINFCLDIANLTENKNEQKIDITDRETNEIKYSIYVKQNQNTLLPIIARKLIAKKDILKKQLKSLNPETEEAKDLQIKYDATKALTNSLFGVTALKAFRLYDVRIASAITSIVRDLLHFVENKLQEQQMKVTYVDTDSLFVVAKEDPTNLLNDLVKDWAKQYNKPNIDISFDCEGIFDRLLVVALCHYIGYLTTKTGIKKEIKGVEVKRRNSSIFMKKFQEELIEKVLNNESQEAIIEFIALQKEAIIKVPIIEIGFPSKINNAQDYKSPPIFLRALDYSKELFGFEKNSGETFYYCYVKSLGTAERHAKQMRKSKETGEKELKESHTIVEKNVLAYDEETQNQIKEIDYDMMIKRNILDIAEKIFDALKWDKEKIGIITKPKRERKTKAQIALEIVKEQETPIIQSQPTYTEKDFIEEKEIKPYYSE